MNTKKKHTERLRHDKRRRMLITAAMIIVPL